MLQVKLYDGRWCFEAQGPIIADWRGNPQPVEDALSLIELFLCLSFCRLQLRDVTSWSNPDVGI